MFISQRGSNRTNNIDGAEAGFGCPTMQYSNQDASLNNSVVMLTITSEPTLHQNCPWRHLSGYQLLFVPHYNTL